MPTGWLLSMPIPAKWPVAQNARDEFVAWWQEHQDFLAAEHTEVKSFMAPGSPYYDAESVYEQLTRKQK